MCVLSCVKYIISSLEKWNRFSDVLVAMQTNVLKQNNNKNSKIITDKNKKKTSSQREA